MYCGIIHGVLVFCNLFLVVHSTARAMVCLVDDDALSFPALCCFAGHTRLWYDYSLNLIDLYISVESDDIYVAVILTVITFKM